MYETKNSSELLCVATLIDWTWVHLTSSHNASIMVEYWELKTTIPIRNSQIILPFSRKHTSGMLDFFLAMSSLGMSVSVCHIGSIWNVSTAVGWIAMQFCSYLQGPQRIKHTDFSDPLTFCLASWGQKLQSMQYFYVWPNTCKINGIFSLKSTLCLSLISQL